MSGPLYRVIADGLGKSRKPLPMDQVSIALGKASIAATAIHNGLRETEREPKTEAGPGSSVSDKAARR